MGRYDKIHLVPFGEFVPFRPLVNALRKIGLVPDVRDDDLQRGNGWHPLQFGAHRLGVGICFESTFASIARAYAAQGANYLIYITNDAWFQQTAAVRQHFNHARFRALETGLPVVRVASTGISGFIAPDGRILAEIPTYVAGTCRMDIPEGTPGTVYTRGGWLFAPLCLLAALLLAAWGVIIRRRASSRNRTSS
jgi:apolipoprotein N-acyltransferase